MVKKIIFLVVILSLAGAGFFYWWNNQVDVRELNKTLPEGVRVAKSLFGKEYKVVNKIDGYEFKIPLEWKGVKKGEYIPQEEAEYTPKEKEENTIITSLYIEGLEGEGRTFSIDLYKFKQEKSDLKSWAQELFQYFGLEGILENDLIENFKVIKTKEEKHLGGGYVYFLKNNLKIYVFNSGSEEFIRYIIGNGKW